MERVQLGTKVKSLGINRLAVADGTKARAVLIDDCAMVKYLAWDDNLKRRIEVNQDLVVHYGLKPMTVYYYLVAKLNTDMAGNIVSDDFIVEYLQLSENLNNDFSEAINEHGEFTSLSLTKVSKKGDNGKDFSYIKVIPSNLALPESLKSKINMLKSDRSALDSMWQLIDAATSIKPEEYIKLLNGDKNKVSDASTQNVRVIESNNPVKVIESTQPASSQNQPNPSISSFQSDNSFQDSLGLGDPFSDGF